MDGMSKFSKWIAKNIRDVAASVAFSLKNSILTGNKKRNDHFAEVYLMQLFGFHHSGPCPWVTAIKLQAHCIVALILWYDFHSFEFPRKD